jgi:hypothetical protein
MRAYDQLEKGALAASGSGRLPVGGRIPPKPPETAQERRTRKSASHGAHPPLFEAPKATL